MLRRTIALFVALTTCLALVPAAASASAYSEVQAAFNRSQTATIAPCEFSSPTLDRALKESSTYEYQYGADLTNAIQAALSARGDGACSKSKRHLGGLGAAATLSGADGQLPGSATSASSGGLPLVFVLAVALVGAGLLVLAGWVAITALGYDPRLSRAALHSVHEAEHRMSAGWEDLGDRLRRQ